MILILYHFVAYHFLMNRVLFLSILRFGWAICPDGWHEDPETQWCYKAFESGFEKTWNAAESWVSAK